MKLFIGWSGDRSRAIALALRRLDAKGHSSSVPVATIRPLPTATFSEWVNVHSFDSAEECEHCRLNVIHMASLILNWRAILSKK
jgi:hypothetical protein